MNPRLCLCEKCDDLCEAEEGSEYCADCAYRSFSGPPCH